MRLASILTAMAIAMPAASQAETIHGMCGARESIVEEIYLSHGEEVIGNALTEDNDAIIELAIDPDDMSWSLLRTTKIGVGLLETCVIATGWDWSFTQTPRTR